MSLSDKGLEECSAMIDSFKTRAKQAIGVDVPTSAMNEWLSNLIKKKLEAEFETTFGDQTLITLTNCQRLLAGEKESLVSAKRGRKSKAQQSQ